MKKRLILITLALVLLVLGINLLTRGEYFSARVKGYLVSSAGEALGYDVGMGSALFNFFPTYIDIEKPYVRGWDKSKAERSVSADKVRVYLSLPRLLDKTVLIRRIQLYRPSLEVERTPGGGYNTDPLLARIKGLHEKKAVPGAFSLDVKEVVLFDGKFSYSDPGQGIGVSAGDVGVDLRLRDKDSYWVSCNAKDVVARRAELPPLHLNFSGEASWKDGKAGIEALRLDSEGTRVSAKGEVQWSKAPVLDLKFDALVNLALLDRFGLWKGGPAGEAELKGVVKGAYPKLEGEGSLALRDVIYKGVKVDGLSSGITFSDRELKLPELKGRLMGGSAEGEAAIVFGGDTFSYTSSWKLRDLISGYYTQKDRGLAFIPWYSVSGNLGLSGKGLDASGVTAAGRLDIKKYEKPHPAPGVNKDLSIVKAGSFDFRLKDRLIRVENGMVSSAASEVNFNGTVGLDGESDLVIKGHSRDIGEISTIIGYSDTRGSLDLTAYMRGNIVEPEIIGKGLITDAYAHGVPFKSAYGDVRLSKWVISFRDFLINQDGGSFLLNGSIAFKGEGASFEEPFFHARLGVKDVEVRKIISIFYEDIPVNLTADGELNFEGNVRKFKGDGHLLTGKGDVYGQQVDKGEVSAVLSENDITFPKVVAVKDRDIVTASGGIRFDNTFYGKASSARVDLGNFNLLAGTAVPVQGTFSASVTGEGSFDRPDIKANVQAYKLYYKGVDLGGGSFTGRIKDKALAVDGTILEERAALEGSLGLASPYAWRGRLTFKGGGFEKFVKLVYKGLPEDVTLVSTGVLTGEGALDEPSRTSFSLDFSKVSAGVMGRTLQNDGHVSLSYRDGRLSVKSLRLKGQGVDIGVEGVSAGLDEVDVKVAATADLEILKKTLEKNVDYIDGKGRAELAVRGSLKEPVLSGKIEITGAGLKFKEFQQRFDSIDADVTLEKGGFTLDRLDAVLGGGGVSAKGKGALKGFSVDSFSIDLKADSVRVKYPEELVSTVDARLTVEGALDRRDITGEIVIKKARYTERVEWKSWILKLQKKKAELFCPDVSPVGATGLNVHVKADKSMKIDNNVAKIPVSADLYLRGTIECPFLTGRLESSGGNVYFRNNEFRLLNGVAEFADPRRFNPIIDIQAETKVKEYDIQLTLSGNLDRIKVSLQSDPPLDDADIITLLTIGRTSEELKGHEAAITTGEAASFLTGQIQDAVESRMRKITGFDRFQIDPYLTSTGATSGPRLTVGKSLLSDKLLITYSTNPGTSVDQFVRMEYIFNKNLSLVGERDEQGRVGGDLKFRFEFK